MEVLVGFTGGISQMVPNMPATTGFPPYMVMETILITRQLQHFLEKLSYQPSQLHLKRCSMRYFFCESRSRDASEYNFIMMNIIGSVTAIDTTSDRQWFLDLKSVNGRTKFPFGIYSPNLMGGGWSSKK
jgi:hypothetical protein